jgi:outer membrane biosynthesis protein TonB
MFPNVRLMAASALVSVMALFFAFGVYASLRVSHEPLARSSRAAPLQLVGFNVAMLPITVLEPFADKRAAPTIADNGSALAFSSPQATAPQPAPTIAAPPDAHGDNAVDEPAENNDVTQMQITEAVETAQETKPADPAPQEITALIETVQQSAAATAPPEVPAAPTVAPEPPQVSPVEHTATIETLSAAAAAAEPAAADDDTLVDTDIATKKKKKKHTARRHLYRAPVRTAAQSAAPQQPSAIWPAGIGGPLVTAPKR